MTVVARHVSNPKAAISSSISSRHVDQDKVIIFKSSSWDKSIARAILSTTDANFSFFKLLKVPEILNLNLNAQINNAVKNAANIIKA